MDTNNYAQQSNTAPHPETTLGWHEFMSLLNLTKLPHEITDSDINNKGLASVEEWKQFYDAYSGLVGFSTRCEHVRRDTNKIECARLWVCSREGVRRNKWLHLPDRKKPPKAITRIGCMARLLVTRNKNTGAWVATTFQSEHNHDLASPSEVQFLRSHRVVPPNVVSEAKAMRAAGIRTISILDFLAHQFGGREKLPFLKKDLYNKLTIDRRTVNTETDCEGALGYLTCLAIRDEHFFCRFNVDEDNRLNNIFWADGQCRRDYSLFGEVIAFDTTYRTNAYKKPLLIIVGVNNHYRTTVFALALLADETRPTFSWALHQFCACMDNKKPNVVLTDGDHAMKGAILEHFPNAVHRLCAWHLETNAGVNVPNGEFKIQFTKLLYRHYSEQEFEEQWTKLVEQHNLEENDWALSLYQKRKSWAETFLRGHFFAGMRTTQRCESMNAYMRRFLESKMLLRDFVSQIDQGLQALRHQEMQDDFVTKHTDPVIPLHDPLYPYYAQLSQTCTRNMYTLIAKQIQGQNAYSINACDYNGERREYHLTKFRAGQIPHIVHYHSATTTISCTCLFFETDGIPCRHIFAVLKHLSVEKIPTNLLRACWHKDIKHRSNIICTSTTQLPSDMLQTTRMGTLSSHCHTLAYYASKYDATYEDSLREIQRLTEKIKNDVHLRESTSSPPQVVFDEGVGSMENIVRDPVVAKTKGREKEPSKGKNQRRHIRGSEIRRKHCRLCNDEGHNIKTCPLKLTDHSHPNINLSQRKEPHGSQAGTSSQTIPSAQPPTDTYFTPSFNYQPPPYFGPHQSLLFAAHSNPFAFGPSSQFKEHHFQYNNTNTHHYGTQVQHNHQGI